MIRFTVSMLASSLAGDIGYLTGEHGLSIDNLVQVRHITLYLVYYLTSA